jgi:NifU-like protein involved in Fe-S cluster formation
MPTKKQVLESLETVLALGGLPNGNEHCALLTENTLKEAIKNCLNSKKRGLYRPE